jgi:hypothetical protein
LLLFTLSGSVATITRHAAAQISSTQRRADATRDRRLPSRLNSVQMLVQRRVIEKHEDVRRAVTCEFEPMRAGFLPACRDQAIFLLRYASECPVFRLNCGHQSSCCHDGNMRSELLMISRS